MNFNENLLFVFLGMVLIAVEIILGAVTGFELLVLGVILIISGGFGYFTGSFLVALVTATALVFFYIFFGRKKIQNYLILSTKKTNVDSLIGKHAIVTESISPTKVGKVKIEGEVWRAESKHSCKEGDRVKIVSVSGVTLSVEPL